MTMVSIQASHGGKDLTIILSKRFWNYYPVMITKTEMKTLRVDRVQAIMTDTYMSPSALAGLSPNQIESPLISRLDRDFKIALLDYKTSLTLAECNDLEKLIDLNNRYRIRNYNGWFGWGFRALQSLGMNDRSEEYVAIEGSAHRKRWLYDIDTKENIRLNKIKADIQEAIKPLLEDIQQINRHGQHDILRLRKLYQLKLVYEALFPNENNRKISNLQRLFPANVLVMINQPNVVSVPLTQE